MALTTRQINTKREIEFLSGTYWDCAQFVFNSGFNSIGIVNSQFDNMIGHYVAAGKIKQESYKKFQELVNLVPVSNYCRADFIANMGKAYTEDVAVGNLNISENFWKDFQTLLSKQGIKIKGPYEKMLFLHLLYDLNNATNNGFVKEYADRLKDSWSMNAVDFRYPVVKTSDGDGCSHGVTYGNAFKNLDKLNKRW